MVMQYKIHRRELRHDGFFKMYHFRLSHDLYAGGEGAVISREMLDRGHAAAALLYDPRRDEVVMVEQFRIGAIEGDQGAWLLEIVAGMYEPGEDAEELVRRESEEEAGVTVARCEFISEFLLSPGGCSERLALYCGEVDSSHAGGIHGLAEEGEDIKVVVLPAEEAIAMAQRGEIYSATPLVALFWLALNRDRLRLTWV